MVVGIMRTNNYRQFKILNPDNHSELIFETDNIEQIKPAMPDDIVEFNIDKKQVEKVINRPNDKSLKNIVGILQTSSKIKYGIDKKGKLIYLFLPIQKDLPPFLVSSKINSPLRNQWAIIEYNENEGWNNISNKPRGNLVEILGSVGIYSVEKLALVEYYRPRKQNYSNNLRKNNIELVEELESIKKDVEELQNLNNNLDTCVVSIDPEGCRDIDDCFNIIETPSNIILKIHIADVSYYIKPESYIDKIAGKNLGATLYISQDENIPMLPIELSSNLLSLLPNVNRRVITLEIIIDKTSSSIVCNKIYHNIIRNSKALTYDNCKDYINSNLLSSCAKILGNYLDTKNTFSIMNYDDPHIWIEVFMIYYNNYVANSLNLKYGNAGLYRNQLEKDNTNLWANLMKDKTLPNELKFLLMESANYSTINQGHFTLGLNAYTHATSPIRRYADILVQRLLLNNDENSININNQIVETLNEKQKLDKKFYRDIAYLNNIYNKEDIDAIILDSMPHSKDKLIIYIEKWKLSCKIHLLDKSMAITECINNRLRLKYYVDENNIRWNKKVVFQLV